MQLKNFAVGLLVAGLVAVSVFAYNQHQQLAKARADADWANYLLVGTQGILQDQQPHETAYTTLCGEANRAFYVRTREFSAGVASSIATRSTRGTADADYIAVSDLHDATIYLMSGCGWDTKPPCRTTSYIDTFKCR